MFEWLFKKDKARETVLALARIGHLSKLGEHAKAVELCDKLIAEEPNERLYYAYRGSEKAKTGDLNGAIPDFEKADELDPKRCTGTQMWAEFLSENGQKEEAAKLFEKRKQKLLEWEKANPGHREKEIEEYNKEINEAPNKPGAYASRGREKAKIGDMEGAIADFEKADELSQNIWFGTIEWARVLNDMGKKDEALELLERKMAEDPKKERILRVLYMRIKEGTA